MSDLPFQEYLANNHLQIVGQLGYGKDGVVFETSRPSAVKKFKSASVYLRELRAYKLLDQLSIARIDEFNLPRLIGFSETAGAIEITIVCPPFIVDFASTHDEVEMEYFDFPDEVWTEREYHWAEIFGEQWPRIQAIRNRFLELTGLTYLDLTRNNIRLR